jgi:hypothetical protein
MGWGESPTPPVHLGEEYVDSITGFQGTATARTEYLYGCVRVVLEGVGKDGTPEEWVFDEQRLITPAGVSPTLTATSGGSRPAPPRTGLR